MSNFGRLLAAVFLTFGCFGSSLIAIGAEDPACEEAETTAAMLDCANRLYSNADEELNLVYKQLMSQLAAERREPLRDAQKAWIEFRDKNVAFVASDVEGGTLYPVIEASKLAEMTERRTLELKEQLR